MKEKNTLRYSLNDLPKDSRTDWERIKNITESKIEAAAASDGDAQPTDETFWANAEAKIRGQPQGLPDVGAGLVPPQSTDC